MAQITLNSSGVASNGSLVLQSNGTTAAVTIDTSQRAAFVAGTAALPAITTTGDTNTGIYFPAADTIAFTEGGTEAMRLDSAGNMGLGVTPSAWNAAIKALEMPDSGFLAFANTNGNISTNAFFDTGYKYKATAAAARYSQSSGQHLWFNAASGTAGNTISFTQAMTLDASGRLGIGQTSPVSQLHITPSTANVFTEGLRVNREGQTGQYTIVNYASGIARIVAVDSLFNSPSLGFFTSSDGSTQTERARITSGGWSKFSNTGTYTNAARFHEMRTDQGDYSAVFTCSAASSPYGLNVQYTAAAPNNTTSTFIECADSSLVRAVIRSNGGLANYSANNVNLSDRREKTNFAPAKSYLDVICAIPIQTYNYIDQNMEEDGGLTLGVVAQDVQAVAPELVTESDWSSEKDGSKMRLSIYQTDMQYALMKCIQEQQAIITTLTDRITALEAK